MVNSGFDSYPFPTQKETASPQGSPSPISRWVFIALGSLTSLPSKDTDAKAHASEALQQQL